MPVEKKLSWGDLSGPRADGLRGEERATVHGAVKIALGVVAVWDTNTGVRRICTCIDVATSVWTRPPGPQDAAGIRDGHLHG